MKKTLCGLFVISASLFLSIHTVGAEKVRPSRTELITPLHKDSFNDNGQSPEIRRDGNPRMISGVLVFDGMTDGRRQEDPHIAVGGGYILYATNSGIMIYTKEGEFVQGISQAYFNGGIDPKMFYDPHNKVFGFDLWYYWDKPQTKPANISISESSDPRGAWNTYPVPASNARDGGAIGYSKKWIGYTYPGGEENAFILKMAQAKKGRQATVYHFKERLGQPIFSQDASDDLYFIRIDGADFVINRITEDDDGAPVSELVSRKAHNLANMGRPPRSPQKNTDKLTASGSSSPKNAVLQNGYIWFSQAINYNGRSAVQWNQIETDGTVVQTGLISGDDTSYIQTTIAVNKENDVLIGFQETNSDMFISPRMAYRLSEDPPGTIREILHLGEGEGPTDGGAWGDYSGSVVDGDNLLDLWTVQSLADPEGKHQTVVARLAYSKNKK